MIFNRIRNRLRPSPFSYVLIGLALTFAILCGYGYAMNIMEIIATVNDPITGMFVLRCLAILLWPLGIILGFM